MTTRSEWGRITRFYKSAKIAFQREIQLLESPESESANKTKLNIADGQSKYSLTVDQHKDTLIDDRILCSMVLIYSYAVAEGAAAEKLGYKPSSIPSIETWGERLLRENGMDWNSVRSGKAGFVEVAVIRNVLTHGSNQIDQGSMNRLVATGPTTWNLGDRVSLNQILLHDFRSRLKSLLRHGGII